MPQDETFRMDEFSTSAFETMGFKQPFDSKLVESLRSFKALKDRLQPGRLTPEGFAFVASLASLAIPPAIDDVKVKGNHDSQSERKSDECLHSRKTELFKPRSTQTN